jgi:parallel beta-helix repeat protein
MNNCDNNDISDNTAYSNTLDGILIDSSHENTISNNILTWNDDQGLSLVQSENNTISLNEIKYNQNFGLYLDGTGGDCNYNEIDMNTVSNNKNDGLKIDTSHNNNISRNLLSNNQDNGLSFELSENNTIYDNNIEFNSEYGILLYKSDYNNFSENVVNDNRVIGIFVNGVSDSSDNNLFYLNFFRDNGKHVIDDGTGNNWNNSITGNYWQNYTGVDADINGFGDTPHIISSSPLIRDFLPIWDGTAPNLTIYLPIVDETYDDAPSFNIQAIDEYLDSLFYSIFDSYSWTDNATFTVNGTISQAIWDSLPGGTLIIRFYAIDKAGNLAYMDISIEKYTPPAPPPPQDFTFIMFLAIIIGTAAISFLTGTLIISRRYKKIIEEEFPTFVDKMKKPKIGGKIEKQKIISEKPLDMEKEKKGKKEKKAKAKDFAESLSLTGTAPTTTFDKKEIEIKEKEPEIEDIEVKPEMPSVKKVPFVKEEKVKEIKPFEPLTPIPKVKYDMPAMEPKKEPEQGKTKEPELAPISAPPEEIKEEPEKIEVIESAKEIKDFKAEPAKIERPPIKLDEHELVSEPLDEEGWMSRAEKFKAEEKYMDAIQCYEEVLNLNPKNEKAWYSKGEAHEMLDQYDLAMKCFDEAIKNKEE